MIRSNSKVQKNKITATKMLAKTKTTVARKMNLTMTFQTAHHSTKPKMPQSKHKIPATMFRRKLKKQPTNSERLQNRFKMLQRTFLGKLKMQPSRSKIPLRKLQRPSRRSYPNQCKMQLMVLKIRSMMSPSQRRMCLSKLRTHQRRLRTLHPKPPRPSKRSSPSQYQTQLMVLKTKSTTSQNLHKILQRTQLGLLTKLKKQLVD